MRVVVLGGMGFTGKCAVFDLLENPKVEKVTVVDIKESVKFNDKRVEFKKVDVRDVDATAKLLEGNDVVINAVQYYFNMDIMKAAAKAKVNYVDLGGLFHTTKEQLKLDSLFRDAGLLAIVGMGGQPGVSSVLAKYAVDKMDTVDTIIVRDAWADTTENYSKFYFTWSPATLFDELTMPAIHFNEGKYLESDALAHSEEYDFGGKIGKVTLFRTLHSEVATMPESFADKGVKYVEWLEGGKEGDIAKLKLIADMGFGKTDEFEVDGMKFKPRDFLFKFLKLQGLVEVPEGIQVKDFENTVVEVRGKNNGKDIKVVMEAHFKYDEKWKVSASGKEVGVPASIVAQMMVSGLIKGKGVKPAELVVPPKEFFEELNKRDIGIVSKEEAVLA